MAGDPQDYWETEMKARDYNYAAGYKAGLLEALQHIDPRGRTGKRGSGWTWGTWFTYLDALIAHVQATGTLEGE